MNGAERNASRSFIGGPSGAPGAAAGSAGGRRTKRAAGTSVAHTNTAMTACAWRQSICVIGQAANGDMVTGATPTPTETSATARPRRSLIQPITAAIIGEKKLATAIPTSTPNESWKASTL